MVLSSVAVLMLLALGSNAKTMDLWQPVAALPAFAIWLIAALRCIFLCECDTCHLGTSVCCAHARGFSLSLLYRYSCTAVLTATLLPTLYRTMVHVSLTLTTTSRRTDYSTRSSQ